MTIDASPMDCTKVITGPGGLVGLIVAIVQGLVLIILGPTIMLYGPTVPRFTSLIKAVCVLLPLAHQLDRIRQRVYGVHCV